MALASSPLFHTSSQASLIHLAASDFLPAHIQIINFSFFAGFFQVCDHIFWAYAHGSSYHDLHGYAAGIRPLELFFRLFVDNRMVCPSAFYCAFKSAERQLFFSVDRKFDVPAPAADLSHCHRLLTDLDLCPEVGLHPGLVRDPDLDL